MSTQPPAVPTEPVAAASQTYICPKCAGKMNFDAASGMLNCPFCGHSMPVPTTTDAVKEHDLLQTLQDESGKAHGYGTDVKAINCKSCGATVNVPANVTSTQCPFCGSNQVIEQKPDPKLIQPESVVPFGVDEATAHRKFRDWLGQGWFHPNDLKALGGGQKLRGVYLPFWTFDAHAESNWRAESGDYYYETEWVTVTRDGKQVREQQQVQKVRWYWTSGHHSGEYDDVLVYATRSINLKILQKIYPYDTQKLLTYKPDFLAGWSAEAYQIPLAEAWPLGRDILYNHEHSACDSLVPGDTHRNLSVSTDLSQLTYKHVLLPVWVASYRYNNKTFQFMINGQTGKVQGEKPISAIKVAIAVVVALIIIGIVLYLISKADANNSSGEILMYHEYARLQLETLPLLM
jgi:DNA-directed RNA polymerase subunit RPC12/RpoP